MLALAKANPDTMDIFLLIALILFLVGAVLSLIERSVVSTLTLFGLSAMTVAFMFLT